MGDEEKKVLVSNNGCKPILKTQTGLTREQKYIMKSLIGKSPKLPAELGDVRDWEKVLEEE